MPVLARDEIVHSMQRRPDFGGQGCVQRLPEPIQSGPRPGWPEVVLGVAEQLLETRVNGHLAPS